MVFAHRGRAGIGYHSRDTSALTSVGCKVINWSSERIEWLAQTSLEGQY